MNKLVDYKEMSLPIAFSMYPQVKDIIGDLDAEELMKDINYFARVLVSPTGDLLRFQIWNINGPRANDQDDILVLKPLKWK